VLLAGADLSEADLRGARLTQQIAGANFKGARMPNGRLFT
jgi:uncharacterized protein YjbI with pentapeptide repeats